MNGRSRDFSKKARGTPGLEAGEETRSHAPRTGGVATGSPGTTSHVRRADVTSGQPAVLHSGVKRHEEATAPYWSGAHTTHRLQFHLVWIPKYRRRVLEGAIATRLRALLLQACAVNDWHLHEVSVQPDHVHLLLQIHPRESVAQVVKQLKGGSSRLLRAEFPELEEFLWGKSFWGNGYFAESVGQTQEEVIRRYIRDQGGQKPDPDEKLSG